MATIDADYVTLTAIIGAAIGDTAADLDKDPDWVTATEGTVTFTPNIEAVNATNSDGKTVRVVPFPIVCAIDAQGRLTFNGDPAVTLLDLGSSKVNPSIPRDKAAYNVTFTGVKMDAATVKMSPFGINPSPEDAVAGSINLWDIAPLATGAGGAAIVRGQGLPSITTAAAGDVVTYDGSEIKWAKGATGASVASAVTAPPAAASVTQGLYQRVRPAPDSGGAIIPLCADPNNTGVLWVYGLTSQKIGYTTDHGTTFVPVTAVPNGGVAGMTPCQIAITSGVAGGDFMFLVLNSTTPNQGQVWRSPAPNATGSNITWTQIFGYDTTTNLINGPGGTSAGSVGAGENLRNSSFAVTPDGSHAYVLPYAIGAATAGVAPRSDGIMTAGSTRLALPTSQAFQGWEHGNMVTVAGAGAAGANLTARIAAIYSANQVDLQQPAQTSVAGATVTFTPPVSTGNTGDLTAGPIIRVCANPCTANPAAVTWTPGKQWIMARHGHAVRVIDGKVWVSLGDYPYPQSDYGEPPITHVGVHCATSLAATAFNQVTSAKTPYPWDCINIYPVTIGGADCIIGESDSAASCGPILVPSRAGGGITPPRLLHQAIPPNVATMRCLTVDPANGNVFYYATSEGGVIGQTDAIMMSAAPYTVPIVLETLPAPTTMGAVYDAILDGPYVWFGSHRITREKIIGQ